FFFFFSFLLRRSLWPCRPSWSAGARSRLTATSTSQVRPILPASASQVAGITASASTPGFFFFPFVVELGFHHVGQAGYKLLTSCDPPTSGSQSTGIIGVSHCAWPPSHRMLYATLSSLL
uniref:Secreted protein n=1 Tax=Macaca fascicularis TaxID=9541 RepID=A0A7N9CCM5_MACFA